jgi:large repetitive protein
MRGTVTRVDNTRLTYAPNSGAAGTDTFKYVVTDPYGATATATVNITLQNRPPVAVADTVNLANSSVSTIVQVTANDYDPDGAQVRLGTPPIASAPANGTAVMETYWSIRYTPRACFAGTDTFQYVVSDYQSTNNGTVTVNVANDHKPIAVVDTYDAAAGYIAYLQVTSNDCDPDGPKPYLDSSLWLEEPPLRGVVRRYDANTIKYTAPDSIGTDTLRYRVRDNEGNYRVATVTINVR